MLPLICCAFHINNPCCTKLWLKVLQSNTKNFSSVIKIYSYIILYYMYVYQLWHGFSPPTNWHLSPISIINWYRSSRAAAAYYWRNNQAGSGSLSSKKDKTYYWRRYLCCVNHQYLLDKKDRIDTWLHISDILCHSYTIVLKYCAMLRKVGQQYHHSGISFEL